MIQELDKVITVFLRLSLRTLVREESSSLVQVTRAEKAVKYIWKVILQQQSLQILLSL